MNAVQIQFKILQEHICFKAKKIKLRDVGLSI
jgi:hypothetical protein